MNSRRNFLSAAGLAALAAAPQAKADDQRATAIYLHGMVWNHQLAGPMNDWLVRLDAEVQLPVGNNPPPATAGFATFGDDIHDNINSHVTVQSATLKGDQLTVVGSINESKTGTMVGETVRIEGKLVGNAVQNLTVTIGNSTFNGAGLLVVIAIIAILIG
jgi:hypothetical protein